MAIKFTKKFKVGDRVEITNDTLTYGGKAKIAGVCGVISKYLYDSYYEVNLDKAVTCLTVGKNNAATIRSGKLKHAHIYQVELL